jgi:uncharacterized membrane protein YphA (DoxX/SURF4 family)
VTGIATALAWLLAGGLLVAAGTKLRDRRATAGAFAALDLPAAGALAWAVPVAEVATAVLLLGAPRSGGAAALLLLVAFSAFLAHRLRGGRTIACGCFGSVRSAPTTSAALLRNGMLAAGAATVAVHPGAGPAVPPLEAAVVAGTLAAIGMVVVGLWDLRARTGRLWDNRLPAGPGGGP